MNFDELDNRMRVFENGHDHSVLPGVFMVARVDGRNFTRLTKELHSFNAPFDEQMRDYMISTTQHLMQCGFRIIYGYTQSDEISLLFHPGEEAFGRKERKFNSILAGEASARFSLLLGDLAAFDCRISQLPRAEDVVDYFR
jgi:tRNA(His) 5'-end guanylyltransferase